MTIEEYDKNKNEITRQMINEIAMTISVKMNNDIEEAIVSTVKSQLPFEEEIEVNAEKIIDALEKQQKPMKPIKKFNACLCGTCRRIVWR